MIVKTFEGDQQQQLMLPVPSPNFLFGVESSFVDRVNNFIKSITTTIECYNWAFSEKLLKPNQLFSSSLSSNTIALVSRFLKYYALPDILLNSNNSTNGNSISIQQQISNSVSMLSPNELNHHIHLRCLLLNAMFEFIRYVVEAHPDLVLLNDFVVLRLIAITIVHPTKLGFTMNEQDLLDSTANRACLLLEYLIHFKGLSAPIQKQQVLSVISDPIMEQITTLMHFHFKNYSNNNDNQQNNSLHLQDLNCLLRGLLALHNCKLLPLFLTSMD